jgi:hypothetical protein
MEPKFQTSFIPKNPISSSSSMPSINARTSFGIISVLGTVLFILSLVVAGGLFAYEQIVQGQMAESVKALDLAKSEFDQKTLNQLITAGAQITTAKKLLTQHIMASNIFAILQQNVLPQVSFTTFDFSRSTDGGVKMSVSGEAISYGVLRQQSQIFSGVNYFKNPSFSDLNLTTKGLISIRFETDVDPSIISYKKSISNSPVSDSSANQNTSTADSLKAPAITGTVPTNNI